MRQLLCILLLVLALFPQLSADQLDQESPPPQDASNPANPTDKSDYLSLYIRSSSVRNLSEKTPPTYVFSYLPSFSGPLILTLQIEPGGKGVLKLHWIKLPKPHQAPNGFDKLRVSEEVLLSSAQVGYFLGLLHKMKFWNSPSRDPDGGGLDGSRWIYQASLKGKYHYTERWSPTDEWSTEDFHYRAPAMYLLKQFGLEQVDLK